MQDLINLCADFIKNFTFPVDYDELSKQLVIITKANYELHNITFEPDIRFEEMNAFGASGKVTNQSKTIIFNKKRIETILNINIDCFDKNHLETLWNFYNTYQGSTPHDEYQEYLYAFMQKYISLNSTEYFSQMGSIKNIHFELIETILHENQHVFQSYFWTLFLSGQIEPNEQNAIMIFTMTFNSIFNQLKNENVEINYVRKNYIFPIEFDARYVAMHILSQLRDQHFQNDKNFHNCIINSNIIPQDFDIDATSEKIFNDYVMLYEKYNELSLFDYSTEHEFIIKNKEIIIKEIKRRYTEMITTCNEYNTDEQTQLINYLKLDF